MAGRTPHAGLRTQPWSLRAAALPPGLAPACPPGRPRPRGSPGRRLARPTLPGVQTLTVRGPQGDGPWCNVRLEDARAAAWGSPPPHPGARSGLPPPQVPVRARICRRCGLGAGPPTSSPEGLQAGNKDVPRASPTPRARMLPLTPPVTGAAPAFPRAGECHAAGGAHCALSAFTGVPEGRRQKRVRGSRSCRGRPEHLPGASQAQVRAPRHVEHVEPDAALR